MKNRYVHLGLSIATFLIMVVITLALWQGWIPIEWLISLGYKGIFVISLINGIAPFGGPSQIATFFLSSRLNPFFVGIASATGGAIGELAGYAFGYYLRRAQTANVERKIEQLANWRLLRITRERSFFPLLILASIPNPFFDPVSALAGSLKIGLVQYFIPVWIGKTIRHLVISYAGYYMLSHPTAIALNRSSIMEFIYSGLFIGIVFCIAVVAWLVRTIYEDEADPFLLNFTFFAFAGQCILTAELFREGPQEVMIKVAVFLVPAVILLLLQVFTIRLQVSKTVEHYAKVLDEHKIGDHSPSEIDGWASVLVRITGVDFFPEFYQKYIKVGSPREKRRKQAILVLPPDKFAKDGLKSEDLIVPPEDRQFLWRCYFFIFLFSWLVFIACIVFARRHP
jgi:membrane protein YqaA with SNARE-associated domain